MEKFNNGKPFMGVLRSESYNAPHGRDSGNKFALCPYGKSKSLPFCDNCGQEIKTKSEIKQNTAK